MPPEILFILPAYRHSLTLGEEEGPALYFRNLQNADPRGLAPKDPPPK